MSIYAFTIIEFNQYFLLGYVILNIFILIPLTNSYKVDKKNKVLVNLRSLKAKTYLNLFNLFSAGLSVDS